MSMTINGEKSADSPMSRASIPRVSVIIRSIGRHTLREALDSIALQTYSNLEIVVVNALGTKHPPLPEQHRGIPIRFVDSEQAVVRSRAANTGMAHAQGDYLLFLDDDDWLLPEHIQALVDALSRHPNASIAYAGVECLRFDSEGRSESLLIYNHPFDPIRLLYENYIPMHAVLFARRWYLEGCHFDETLDTYEDWDFWLQLRQRGPFIHVDQISAVYRIDPTNQIGTTANQGVIGASVERIIAKWRASWTDTELRQVFEHAKYRQKHQQLKLLETKHWERAEQLQAETTELHTKIETLTNQLDDQKTQLQTSVAELTAIQTSSIWRFSYPYRYWMTRLRSWLASKRPIRHVKTVTKPHPASSIDVIIPVYSGYQETRACLESVLAASCQTVHEIIVINDAGPEPAITAYLHTLADAGSITLLHNSENLGFVLTCNRGMALHPQRDVVLLNSDTVVANDWLDRLIKCVYQDQQIGTATPFSNNATIASYPRFCADNALPKGYSVMELDRLFAQLNAGEILDMPTAIGFCMVIRRDCLNQVGTFDTRHFGKGYGEENDFSMRAKALGWRHVLCADTFVYHAGSVSFADHDNAQKNQAIAKLAEIHPDYLPQVHHHIAQDPARVLRLRVDLARFCQLNTPVLLWIGQYEQLVGSVGNSARVLLLQPVDDKQFALSWLQPGEVFQLFFALPDELTALQDFLGQLGIQHLQYLPMPDDYPQLRELPRQLGVSWDRGLPDGWLDGLPKQEQRAVSVESLLPFATTFAYQRFIH
ncbi:MAG: glycosyltransferase [Candidatus Competibacteraceae bacterium]|nr:glycosyltransferase [Candidatus Competibacteraceae bacterium]